MGGHPRDALKRPSAHTSHNPEACRRCWGSRAGPVGGWGSGGSVSRASQAPRSPAVPGRPSLGGKSRMNCGGLTGMGKGGYPFPSSRLSYTFFSDFHSLNSAFTAWRAALRRNPLGCGQHQGRPLGTGPVARIWGQHLEGACLGALTPRGTGQQAAPPRGNRLCPVTRLQQGHCPPSPPCPHRAMGSAYQSLPCDSPGDVRATRCVWTNPAEGALLPDRVRLPRNTLPQRRSGPFCTAAARPHTHCTATLGPS